MTEFEDETKDITKQWQELNSQRQSDRARIEKIKQRLFRLMESEYERLRSELGIGKRPDALLSAFDQGQFFSKLKHCLQMEQYQPGDNSQSVIANEANMRSGEKKHSRSEMNLTVSFDCTQDPRKHSHMRIKHHTSHMRITHHTVEPQQLTV